MKLIPFESLYRYDFNLNTVFAMFQHWGNGTSFSTIENPRKPHGLLFYNDCSGVYEGKNGAFLKANRGDVIYLPSGARYKTTFSETNEKNPSTVLIDFSLYDTDEIPFRLSETPVKLCENKKELYSLFAQIAVLYEAPVQSIMLMKSHIYKLLSDLCGMERRANISTGIFQSIAKGIHYLEENADQTLSIDEIASLCNVSGNCFRRLFKRYAGVSPNEFRLTRKIERAWRLLESGTVTVSEAADLLQFEDVAYFSRLFKKKTGFSPSRLSGAKNN